VWVIPNGSDDTVAKWLRDQDSWGVGLVVVGCIVGAVLTVVAPWITKPLANVDRSLVAGLLGGDPADALRERVSELTHSRDASVVSATSELKRIERDLHDGAQQRLVSLAMDLGLARQQLSAGADPAQAAPLVARAHDEAKAAIAELRDLVRGIHPSVLTDRGLDAAISALVARCPVPVEVTVDVPVRPSAAVEATAYFVVAEALTNVAKHSRASRARVEIRLDGDHLYVQVSDNGVGGAETRAGGGLAGLRDRVAAVEGRIAVGSPAGGPTMLMVDIPCGS
jgi:signal transduction histidine kinase